MPSDAASSSPAAHTLAGKDLQTLADDPDDLARELRQLAATTGANPANTIITVDGFQNESALPPKSSIASIKVNPDLYSAEYREPPFEGGRVEVYTKPGQPAFHGALFTTNGSSWMNARNPFSVSEGTLGKQRYGAELGGPVRRQGSDFALSFEHRQINNTAIVNAMALDPNGNPQSVVDSVPIPQTLWLATARNGWQLGAKTPSPPRTVQASTTRPTRAQAARRFARPGTPTTFTSTTCDSATSQSLRLSSCTKRASRFSGQATSTPRTLLPRRYR